MDAAIKTEIEDFPTVATPTDAGEVGAVGGESESLTADSAFKVEGGRTQRAARARGEETRRGRTREGVGSGKARTSLAGAAGTSGATKR